MRIEDNRGRSCRIPANLIADGTMLPAAKLFEPIFSRRRSNRRRRNVRGLRSASSHRSTIERRVATSSRTSSLVYHQSASFTTNARKRSRSWKHVSQHSPSLEPACLEVVVGKVPKLEKRPEHKANGPAKASMRRQRWNQYRDIACLSAHANWAALALLSICTLND